MKKTLKIIFIILIIAGFAMFLIWLLSPKGQSENQNFIETVREFLPFGTNQDIIEIDNPSDDPFIFPEDNTNNPTDNREGNLPDIEVIYNLPVGGYAVLGNGTSTTIRVVDRAKGHIIDIDTQTKEQTRISNTTLPGIIEAILFNEGKSVVMRYLREHSDVIETLVISNLSLNGGDTAGIYLDENIISIKPISATELAYITPAGFGSNIFVYNTQTNSTKNIYFSSLQELRIIGGDKNNIYIQTKASFASTGYVYAVSKKTGRLTKIIDGGRGFNSLLSNDVSKLFITGTNGALQYIYDQNFLTETVVDMPTVAQKCVFGNTKPILYCGVPVQFPSEMPDVWYMGIAALTDQLWVSNEDGSTSFLTSLSNIDVIKPQLSANDTHLFFVNKNDGSVWIIRLNQL